MNGYMYIFLLSFTIKYNLEWTKVTSIRAPLGTWSSIWLNVWLFCITFIHKRKWITYRWTLFLFSLIVKLPSDSFKYLTWHEVERHDIQGSQLRCPRVREGKEQVCVFLVYVLWLDFICGLKTLLGEEKILLGGRKFCFFKTKDLLI